MQTHAQAVVERYYAAFDPHRNDWQDLITDDVVFEGPAGRGPLRLIETSANAQPAFGLYGRAPDGAHYLPQVVQVLTLEGDRLARLHGFVRPDLCTIFGLPGQV
jgi:RNA polymerase sigma-70 factor (ECF subfamily)